jgi:hypothetical protein
MAKPLKEASQSVTYTGELSWDIVNASSLLRIAEAVETIAKNYQQLQRDHDYYRDLAKSRWTEIEHLKHSRAGYMAALTKLRKGEKPAQ